MENKLLKKRKSSLKRKIGMIFFLSSFFLSFKLSVLARQLEVAYPGGPSTTAVPLETYIVYIAELIIKGGIILAGLIIAISGVQYLLSFGSVEKIINARNRIFGAFFGVLILISSFLLLRIADPNLVLLEVPSIDPIPPVIVEIPPLEHDSMDPSPGPHKSVITTEVPIGVLIKNIFEFNQFEGGEGEEPYEEPRRMDRIRNISLEINNLTTLALSGNENVTDALKNCSCFSCDLNNIQTIIQNNTETFLSGLKTEYQKGIIELNNLKNDIKKLEEAEKALKNNLSNNIISSAKYYYLRDTYTDWEISSVSLFEELEDYGSFASFHYPTSGISKDEFPTIALESNYNWCSKVPVGDAIELSKVVGNKIAERLETLLKLTFLVISHSTALNTFALSYNDEIYKYDSCRGIMPYYDSNFSELTEKFPGLLKGPYDSVELFNLSQHLSRLQKGKTRIDEVCDTII